MSRPQEFVSRGKDWLPPHFCGVFVLVAGEAGEGGNRLFIIPLSLPQRGKHCLYGTSKVAAQISIPYCMSLCQIKLAYFP